MYINVHSANQTTLFCNAIDGAYDYGFPSLCSIALVCNLINIVVLTRKGMMSPIVLLLIWIAAVDVLEASWGFVHFCAKRNMCQGVLNPYKHAIHLIKYLFYNYNIWLAVSLAVFRLAVVYSPLHSYKWSSFWRVNSVSLAILILVTTFHIPITHIYLQLNRQDNGTAPERGEHLKDLELIFTACIFSLLPCLLLLVFNGLLIRGIIKAKRRHSRLTVNISPSVSSSEQSHMVFIGSKWTQTPDLSFSTGVLVVAVTLFIMVELPEGIILLWRVCGESDPDFIHCCYDVCDFVNVLINTVNFVLYCTISVKFRRTLSSLVIKIKKLGQSLWIPKKELV